MLYFPCWYYFREICFTNLKNYFPFNIRLEKYVCSALNSNEFTTGEAPLNKCLGKIGLGPILKDEGLLPFFISRKTWSVNGLIFIIKKFSLFSLLQTTMGSKKLFAVLPKQFFNSAFCSFY